jgi:hypothetical protein
LSSFRELSLSKMKAFTLSALSTLFAGLTLAHPVDLAKRTSGFSEVDITILQFALTVSNFPGWTLTFRSARTNCETA